MVEPCGIRVAEAGHDLLRLQAIVLLSVRCLCTGSAGLRLVSRLRIRFRRSWAVAEFRGTVGDLPVVAVAQLDPVPESA